MEKGKAEIMEQPEQGRELSQPKVEQGRESFSGKKEAGADCDKDAASKEEAPAQETANVSEKGPEEKTEGQKRQKKYTSGAEKIRDEAEEKYQEAKDGESKAITKALMKEVVKYVTEKCEADPDYNALVIQEHKTWRRCYQFMLKKARKIAAAGSCGMFVEGSTIFAWMDEYYRADDRAEVEAEIEAEKKRAESIKRVEKRKKEKKAKAAVKEKEPIPEAKKSGIQTAKKNSKDIDGQMDMFSMIGM